MRIVTARESCSWGFAGPWLPVVALVLAAATQGMAGDGRGPVTLATGDGLALRLTAGGAVAGIAVNGRDLAPLGRPGGFFVADVAGIPCRDLELLGNPGFEKVRNDKPLGWHVGPDWSLDRRVAHSGKASMRVRIAGPEKRSSGALFTERTVKPNTPYRVSMWLRTDGGAPHFYIVQLDEHGRQHPDYPQICVSHSRFHSDWFRLGRTFTTAFFCRRIRVMVRLWRQTGTAWVDDVSATSFADDYLSPQQLARGAVRKAQNGLEQRCELRSLGLRLRANFVPAADRIVVDGKIEDTRGLDRAITVSFRLPIRALGGTWFEDIQNQQPIEPGVRYGAARLLGREPDQRRTISLYPFSALATGAAGVALAVPMDMPRAFRIGYDSRLGYFITYEFGLTRAAAKFPGTASFRFFIYRIDPRWGFRSAAKRYYDFFPQFFVKRIHREGGIGPMADDAKLAAPDYVAPAFADFNWHRRQWLDANRRELARILQYTEFVGWWGWALGISPKQAENQPSPEKAWAHVKELARRKPPNKVAVCILNCALEDADGQPRLHTPYVVKWGGYNYVCNPDPEITGIGGRINRFTLTYEREVVNVDRFGLDGMRFDNPIVFGIDNFRRSHFKWADSPPVFDHRTKLPVVPLDFSSYECAKAIADDMHRRGKIVGSNYTPTNSPSDIFRISLLDVIGSETLWTWCTNAKLALQRTLADQKTVAMTWQEAKRSWPKERLERELKQAMFYGTFYYVSTMGELYERWSVLTRRLAHAGWEPITEARADHRGVRVERFGSAEGRSLHFTLRNENDRPCEVGLSINAAALGLNHRSHAGVWLLQNSWTFQRLPVRRERSRWLVRLQAPAKDTVVLRIAAAADIARDLLFIVPDFLRKAENYRRALGRAGLPAECADYPRILRALQKTSAMLGSGRATAEKAQKQLRALAAALVVPRLKSDAGSHRLWLEKLTLNTAGARRWLRRAVAALPE